MEGYQFVEPWLLVYCDNREIYNMTHMEPKMPDTYNKIDPFEIIDFWI